MSGVYNLPFGRGQDFGSNWSRPLDALLGGWQINGITTQQTGFPLSPSTQNTSNSGSNVLRPNLTGVSPVVSGSIKSRLNGYLNSAAFSQPAPFTFGNAPRTLSNVRGPGTHNIDFSLFKNFHATDRVNVEFRGEAFNLLNQVVFGTPNTTLSSGQFRCDHKPEQHTSSNSTGFEGCLLAQEVIWSHVSTLRWTHVVRIQHVCEGSNYDKYRCTQYDRYIGKRKNRKEHLGESSFRERWPLRGRPLHHP